MIPLAIPNLSGNEARYLQECVESTFVSSVGPFVDRFEQMVAEASGAKFAVATSAGTTGLHAALAAVGVGRDDLVMLPAFTFIASANAIAQCGAEPWLFDCTAESWTINVPQLQQALETKTHRNQAGDLIHTPTGKRIAAILPVYTLGMPADMQPIVTLAKHYRLPIVADAAAALGATYHTTPIAQLGADLTVFSFNGNKTVTAGGGGAVVGQDEALVKRVRHLTTTARVGADYDHDVVGFNYRMTNLQAAVGCAQMEQLEGFVARKRAIATRYTQELASLPGCSPFPTPDWCDSACWFSGVIWPTETKEIREALRAEGVDARPFWKPMHLQKPYRDCPREGMDVTDSLWQHVLTLPCSTALTDTEQSNVIQAVKDYAAQEKAA